MEPTQFSSPEAGRVIRTPTGYNAFVPAPVPRDISYERDSVLALSRADAALAELSGLGRQLPNPHLLISPYVRREATLSSRIEGTQTELSDLLRDEVEPGSISGAREQTDIREVRNYVAALDHGLDRLSELPLSLRLVREIHARLMEGVRGQHATPGRFRTTQNWIMGPGGATLETAPYVPPPPDEMKDCLADWERFLHEKGSMPDLVQCALMHEQFEAIHPFADGNGRIGRLLITLFLVERGRLSRPLLYLSAYFDAHRDAYYDLLQRVRTHGDWHAWIKFFLEGVAQTAGDAVGQAGQLMDLREHYRSALTGRARAVALLDELFVNPYVTVSRAARTLGVSNPTASKAIATLEAADVLEEITGRAWGRLYVARPILAALEE